MDLSPPRLRMGYRSWVFGFGFWVLGLIPGLGPDSYATLLDPSPLLLKIDFAHLGLGFKFLKKPN